MAFLVITFCRIWLTLLPSAFEHALFRAIAAHEYSLVFIVHLKVVQVRHRQSRSRSCVSTADVQSTQLSGRHSSGPFSFAHVQRL